MGTPPPIHSPLSCSAADVLLAPALTLGPFLLPLGRWGSTRAAVPASRLLKRLGALEFTRCLATPGAGAGLAPGAGRCCAALRGRRAGARDPPHPAMLGAPSGPSQVSQAPVMINVCRVFAKALIRAYKYAFGKILRKCKLFSARLRVLRPGWGSALYLLVIRRVVLPPLPSVPRLLNGNYNPQPPFCYHIPCTLYNNLNSDYSTRMETPGK